MTGEPTHIASKVMMAPELMFLSERVPQAINYCFESAVAITLHFQLCSASYTAIQMKNSRRSASAINPVTTKIRRFARPKHRLLLRKCSGHYASLQLC